LNNDILKSYKSKMLKKNIISVLIGAFVIFIFYITMDYVFNGVIILLIDKINYNLGDFLVTNKAAVVFFGNIVITLFIVIFTHNSYINKIGLIINSIDNTFNHNDELVSLPEEFKHFETKMNNIKYDVIKNQNLVKEAEQRKNDLIVYLAHDLKTPLTSIIGYITLLKNEKQISDENKEKFLDISLNKSIHLENLINEFFEITRFNLQEIKLDLKEINLSMMLEQLIDEFYPVYSEKNINCNIDIEENILINADGLKLARVFDNILKNAITYSGKDNDIFITAKIESDMISIIVKNKGIKIPKNKLNDIFDKFYRVDTSRSTETGGAGLGLAIAKEIVLLHKGNIYAVSNEYTEFHVELPVI
jgi:Signal transduction histidine kinase